MNIEQLERFLFRPYNIKNQLNEFAKARSIHYLALGDKARDELATVEEIQQRQKWIREKLLEGIGGLPETDAPLNARTTGILIREGYKLEKVIFQSRPNVYVTANLYLPHSVTKPGGAVLFLCGHNEDAKAAFNYQRACQYMAQSGLIVLSMDPVGQGERFSYYEPDIAAYKVAPATVEHDYTGKQCYPTGDGITKYFIHDGMRAIDYLLTRPEVDGSRIGVTGNSGGGTQTGMMMVCDPRIAAAAPATYLMDRESYLKLEGTQDAEQIWRGMALWGFDHEDVLLAMVPRPVLVLAAQYDYFPLEATRRTVGRARRAWELFDSGEALQLMEDASTHALTEPIARAMARFFAKVLLHEDSPAELAFQVENEETLWCTQCGQVRGDFPDAKAVCEENADRAAALARMRAATPDEELKRKAEKWLRERVFEPRIPCELYPKFNFHPQRLDNLVVSSNLWWSQQGVMNHAFRFRDCTRLEDTLPISLGVWDGGTTRLQAHWRWIGEQCAAGREVIVLDVSGDGAITPHARKDDAHDVKDQIYVINNLLIWMNDSICAMRIYDVIRSIDSMGMMERVDSSDIKIYCDGKQGLYGLIAAFLDDRIGRVQLSDEPESITQWVQSRYYDQTRRIGVILPEMLQYFDTPELLRWIRSKL